MAFNLFRKTQSGEEGEAKQSNQKIQMLVLLIIIAVFGYMYFFTGFMRPAGEEKQAEPAKKESSTMVKQPIPKREGGGKEGADTLKQAEKSAPVKTDVAKTPVVPPAKPEVAKAPAVKPPPPTKAVPAQTKPTPAAVAKATSPAPKPVAPATKVVVPTKADELNLEEKPAKSAGKFTLLVGEFPEGSLLKDVKASIRKAGVGPLHIKSGKTTKQMHRLVVGEYAEHDVALTEVQKLKKKGVDAFMGESGDKYIVFAGSYLYADRAEVERDRLLKLGMNATIVKNEISIRLAKVSAGTFPTAEKAQAAGEKLKAKGLATDVVELGK